MIFKKGKKYKKQEKKYAIFPLAEQDARPNDEAHWPKDWQDVLRDLAARTRVVRHRRIDCGKILSDRGLANIGSSVADRHCPFRHTGDVDPVLADGAEAKKKPIKRR